MAQEPYQLLVESLRELSDAQWVLPEGAVYPAGAALTQFRPAELYQPNHPAFRLAGEVSDFIAHLAERLDGICAVSDPDLVARRITGWQDVLRVAEWFAAERKPFRDEQNNIALTPGISFRHSQNNWAHGLCGGFDVDRQIDIDCCANLSVLICGRQVRVTGAGLSDRRSR